MCVRVHVCVYIWTGREGEGKGLEARGGREGKGVQWEGERGNQETNRIKQCTSFQRHECVQDMQNIRLYTFGDRMGVRQLITGALRQKI